MEGSRKKREKERRQAGDRRKEKKTKRST